MLYLISLSDSEGLSPGSHKNVSVSCDQCGHIKLMPYRKFVKHKACGSCRGQTITGSNSIAAKYPWLLQYYSSTNPDPASLGWKYSKPLEWVYGDCGHKFRMTGFVFLQNPYCRVCASLGNKEVHPNLAETCPETEKFWSQTNRVPPKNVRPRSSKTFHWKCPDCLREWEQGVNSFVRSPNCSVCTGKKIVPEIRNLASMYPSLVDWWNDKISMREAINRNQKYSWKCDAGHVFEQKMWEMIRRKSCPKCSTSIMQRELYEFVVKTLPDQYVVQNSRTLIAPKEVDIFLPDLRLAIEFNGEYWHSNSAILKTHGMTAKEYHAQKVEACAAVGIVLLFVWEKAWVENRAEVESELFEFLRSVATKRVFDFGMELSSTFQRLE